MPEPCRCYSHEDIEDIEQDLIEALTEEAAALWDDATRLLQRRRQLLAQRKRLIEERKALIGALAQKDGGAHSDL